ncbi:hypothetical protein Tco_0915231 [Tanacetum coccineum]
MDEPSSLGFTPRENDVENVEMDNQKDNCDGEFGNVNNISDEVNFSSGFNTYKKAGGESMVDPIVESMKLLRKSPKTRKHVLKQELADLEMIIDKGNASSDTLHKRAEVVKSIQEVDKLCAIEASQKAKIKWAIEGDENSKYYHGLSINLSKSKLLGVVVSEDRVVQAANRIGCGVLKAPFAYLGSKVGGNMSRIKSWDEIVDKMVDRLSKWKMKTLSIGGRLTLLKAVLGSMPIYHMSIFKVPMKVLQRMESIRIEKGGLVFHYMPLNRALMCKWVWRFTTQKNLLWTRVIKAIHGEDGKNGSGFKVGYKVHFAKHSQEVEH